MGTCHYCHEAFNEAGDLRPYGPGGALVCYDCAHATPERTATAKRAMQVSMAAAEAMSPDGAIVLNDEGFHPFTGFDGVDGIVL